MIARVMVRTKVPAFPQTIWNPFRALLHRAASREFRAQFGLRSSIARQIIEGAGGRVYAENRAGGKPARPPARG